MEIPQAAIDLILESEGVDQPWKWPEGSSGITLGFGCDIGADPPSLEFWRGILSDDEITLLSQAKGKTGENAHRLEDRFRSIHITRVDALKVFMDFSLPREIQTTLKAFPGIEFMPAPVQGAIVSLVYNRGTDTTDAPSSTRRREMRIIHEILVEFQTFTPEQRAACQAEYIIKIALQIRKMKRLWAGTGQRGLLVRRDAEADLCLSAK